MTKASAYETEVSSRGEELKALATAKKITKEATSLAQTDSFVQLVSSTKGNKVVHILKKLATAQASAASSQLASRVQSAIRFGLSSSEDPFAKVKELVSDVLAKLQKEAEEDATQKAFCNKEMKETKAKKDDKTTKVEKLSTKKEQKEAIGTSSIVYHGLNCPMAEGDVTMHFDVRVSRIAPKEIETLAIELQSKGSAGNLLCSKIATSPSAMDEEISV